MPAHPRPLASTRSAKAPPGTGPPPAPEPIPRIPLLVAEGFGERLRPDAVASALTRGLIAGGAPDVDVMLLEGPRKGASEPLDGHFEARLRRARAVVLAERHPSRRTLRAGSPFFEVATRARQSGVPAYAVCARDGLDAFDARMLDLQLVIVAPSARALSGAGRRLGELL